MSEPRLESSLPELPATELWAVFSATGSSLEGFLVTDRERWPGLICFTEGDTSSHALVSWLVAAGKISPDVRVDLRGKAIPQYLCGKLLIPLCLGSDDRLSPCQDRKFVAGMFQRTDSGEGARSFGLIGVAALTPQQNLAIETALGWKLEAR
jgi:hypothetical protein